MRASVVAAITVAVGIGAAFTTWVFTTPASIPPPLSINYQAELERLTREAQGAKPNATNGWDELVAIGVAARKVSTDIMVREWDADETLRLTNKGDQIEAWTERDPGSAGCLAPTARDERIAAEYWVEMDRARVFERLREVRKYESFVKDYSARPAAELRSVLAAKGPVASPPMSLERPEDAIARIVLADLGRSVEAGDWERARARVGDALFLQRVQVTQAGMRERTMGASICEQAAWRVLECARRGDPIDPGFARWVLRELDAAEDVRIEQAIEAQRLDSLETIDVAADMWRSSGVSIGMWEMGDFGSVEEARARVEQDATRARAIAAMDSDAARAEVQTWDDEANADVEHDMFATTLVMATVGGEIRRAIDRERRMGESRLGLALVAYAADHAGTPPQALDALVPEYLDALPKDPSAPDGMYRYIAGPTMKDVVVYSVGFDGEDNGGNVWLAHPDYGSREEGKGYDVVVIGRDPCAGKAE